MTKIEAHELMEYLESNTDEDRDYNPKWWLFTVCRIDDGPYFYVRATNKVTRQERKLWTKKDTFKLAGLSPYSLYGAGNINDATTACALLARRIENLEYRLSEPQCDCGHAENPERKE